MNDHPPAIPAPALLPTVDVGGHNDPGDIVALAFLRKQIEGHHPFARSAVSEALAKPGILLPAGAVVVREASGDYGDIVFAQTPDADVLIQSHPYQTVVTASAATDEVATAIAAEMANNFPMSTDPKTTPLRTWHQSDDGPDASDRDIVTPPWSTISQNYPPAVRAQLASLMQVKRPLERGKMIIWHGAPGTGKTTALRSLAREWAPWCEAQYIADPERFLADPGYILEVLQRPGLAERRTLGVHQQIENRRWRIIIAEDADDFLRADAREGQSASIGRLLNLTDGLLGQGSDVLVVFTTNQPLDEIDPALTRPGRCLARIEFARFTPAEAVEWLPPGSRGPSADVTLAELFAGAGDYL